MPDTDDEFYANEESEDSDASEDSNESGSKDKKPVTASATASSQPSSTQAGQMKRRHSDTDDDETDAAKHSTVAGGSSLTKDSSAADCFSMDTDVEDKSLVKRADADADDARNKRASDAVAKKRAKLEDVKTESSSDINPHGMCRVLTSRDDHSAWVYGLQVTSRHSGIIREIQISPG